MEGSYIFIHVFTGGVSYATSNNIQRYIYFTYICKRNLRWTKYWPSTAKCLMAMAEQFEVQCGMFANLEGTDVRL
jgi:hypothetical protein